MAFKNMNIKLYVVKGSQKVLYAEATKEFVDFLFHFFSLPLGTLIHLMGSTQTVSSAGGLSKLRESVKSLDQIYFLPGIDKDNILNSKTTFNGNMFMLANSASAKAPSAPPAMDYDAYGNYTGDYNALRYSNDDYSYPRINPYPVMNHMGQPPVMKQAAWKLSGGFVKEAVTFMVTDELVVKPLSTVSIIPFINSCGVNNLAQLEGKTLHLGEDEAMKLLKGALSTNAVLTTLLRQTN